MKRSHIFTLIMTYLALIPLRIESASSLRKTSKPALNTTTPTFTPEVNPLAQFTKPVTVSPDGIKFFLRNTYNHLDYGLEFLPNDFSHLVQFLKQGKELHQNRAYMQSVFRLFGNKLKGSPYVNAYAFSQLLEELPGTIGDYFIAIKTGRDIFAMQTQINEMLYSRFLSQFKSFKTNPDDFLKTLSTDIVTALEQDTPPINDPLNVEELRKTTLMFLENGLSKLIWNPHDQYETWQSAKTIANHLGTLFEHRIITDQDDLNDLFRTLIERYCLFIDLTGSEFPATFFEHIKQDIKTQSLLFLDLEEEEDIESKSQRLMRSITNAEQKTLLKNDRKKARA